MPLADVLRQLEQIPDGSLLPVGWVRAQLQAVGAAPAAGAPDPVAAPASWREKLWTCHPETRLGTADLVEAIGRPKSWVDRHCSPRSGYVLLPHRKLDGERIFKAGEIRGWLEQHEEVIARPVTPIVPIARGRKAMR